jgi:hypothetical protein
MPRLKLSDKQIMALDEKKLDSLSKNKEEREYYEERVSKIRRRETQKQRTEYFERLDAEEAAAAAAAAAEKAAAAAEREEKVRRQRELQQEAEASRRDGGSETTGELSQGNSPSDSFEFYDMDSDPSLEGAKIGAHLDPVPPQGPEPEPEPEPEPVYLDPSRKPYRKPPNGWRELPADGQGIQTMPSGGIPTDPILEDPLHGDWHHSPPPSPPQEEEGQKKKKHKKTKKKKPKKKKTKKKPKKTKKK